MVLLNVPRALEADHEDLIASLNHALKSCKAAAPIGRQLLEVLDTHFDRESEAAGPLLATLGNPVERPNPSALETSRFLLEAFYKAHPSLLQEHRTITVLASQLEQLGVQLSSSEAAAFGRRLLTHVRLYDTVLFPAALLAGQSAERTEVAKSVSG